MKKGLIVLVFSAGCCLQSVMAQQRVVADTAAQAMLSVYSKELFYADDGPVKQGFPGLATGFYADSRPVAEKALQMVRPPASGNTAGMLRPVGPSDYYRQHFGFFCKREWDWEKQTKIPVKVRLGTYQQTQRMEGKR